MTSKILTDKEIKTEFMDSIVLRQVWNNPTVLNAINLAIEKALAMKNEQVKGIIMQQDKRCEHNTPDICDMCLCEHGKQECYQCIEEALKQAEGKVND